MATNGEKLNQSGPLNRSSSRVSEARMVRGDSRFCKRLDLAGGGKALENKPEIKAPERQSTQIICREELRLGADGAISTVQ